MLSWVLQTFGLVVDRHSTSWDSFEGSPKNTTVASFTVQLTDYNGKVVDLNGQSWSFPISIYREEMFKRIAFKIGIVNE